MHANIEETEELNLVELIASREVAWPGIEFAKHKKAEEVVCLTLNASPFVWPSLEIS